MKKKRLHRITAIVGGILLAIIPAACVDHDYDLSKSIDMTVTFGGDSLFVPSSSTEELGMDRILDISSTSSVITADEGDYGMSEGDYYLYAANDDESNHSTITTDGLLIEGTTVTFPSQTIGASGTLPAYSASFTVDSSVTPTIQSLHYAETDCTVSISFTATNSTTTLDKGFTITFPSYVTLEANSADANASKYTAEGNTLTVSQSIALPTTLTAHIALLTLATSSDTNNRITFTPGNNATGERGDIVLQGDISLQGPVSATASNEVGTQVVISDITIERMYGIIDPVVDISVDPMAFKDVPDVLQDEDTDLDWLNPQLYITVTNPTELSLDFTQIKFSPAYCHDDGTVTHKELIIGTGHDNTDGTLMIGPDSDGDGYTLCLSEMGAPIPVDDDVKITGLADLLRQIPDSMIVSDIEANVMQYEAWVDLDHTYDLDVGYKFVVPLSFGSDLIISYKDSLSGWRDDLKNIKRADELKVTFDLINKIPLELSLAVTALDEQGVGIADEDIRCTIVPEERTIAQGTIDSPTSSPVEVSITAKDGDISRLDGIVVVLTSTKGDNSNTVINQKQTIQLDNIRLLLVGGITLDLN